LKWPRKIVGEAAPEMFVNRWPSLAGLGVLALGNALFIGPSSVAAAPGDPVVHQVSVAGPINITTQSSPAPLATLNVPKGKWVAWARVRVFYDGLGYRLIQCTLNATNGSTQRFNADAAQSLTSATGGLGDPDADTFALTASLSSTTLAVKFAVRCRNLSGVDDLIPRASDIRIAAMKLGTLTQSALSTATSSPAVNPGQIAGRVLLPELLHGSSSIDLPVQKSSTPSTVASLPLSSGRWFVRASFSVVGVNGHGQDPPVNFGHCRLLVAKDGARPSTAAMDTTVLDVLDDGWEAHRRVYALDVATNVPDPGAARLQCWQADGIGDLVVRGLRITALRAGSLRFVDPQTGATTSTLGSGTPVMLHSRRSEVNLLADQSADVAKISLAAGRWLLMAKLGTERFGESIDCRIVVQGVETDEVYDPWPGTTLVMQMAPNLPQQGQVRLRCTSSEDESVLWARLTAVRVNSP
jgi:hypothetical protein